MSKSSLLRIAMAAVCLAVVWMLGKRESALADLQPNVLPARRDSGISDTGSCPCFNLEVLEAVQWSAQAADGPNCKAGAPLWSIASPPTGIVNAASVHTDLSTCVLVIEFGPAAGAFKADLNLTASGEKVSGRISWSGPGCAPGGSCTGLPVSPAEWDWSSPSHQPSGRPEKTVTNLPDTFSSDTFSSWRNDPAVNFGWILVF